METQTRKGSRDNGPQPFTHESLTSMLCVGVETKIRGAESASYNFADVHHANDLPGVATLEEMADDLAPPIALKVPCPIQRRARGIDPRTMKEPAATNEV
jgi:hypothetical protein